VTGQSALAVKRITCLPILPPDNMFMRAAGALGGRLTKIEPSGAVPGQELLERLVAPGEMPADEKALQFDTFVEQDAGISQTLAFATIVLRNLPADEHFRLGNANGTPSLDACALANSAADGTGSLQKRPPSLPP
jgi:hypothetical protein